MSEKPVLDSQAQPASTETQGQPALGTVTSAARRVREALGRVIVGQGEAIDLALVTLLAGGHALIEGVPGVGKTLLVKAMARSISSILQTGATRRTSRPEQAANRWDFSSRHQSRVMAPLCKMQCRPQAAHGWSVSAPAKNGSDIAVVGSRPR